MHLKNFSMLHTEEGLRLTPSYDQVAAAIYQYKTVALAIGGSANLSISNLKPSNIIKLGEEFQLPRGAIKMAYDHLNKNKEAAKDTIAAVSFAMSALKNKLIEMMEKRWNETFALIGQSLSTKL